MPLEDHAHLEKCVEGHKETRQHKWVCLVSASLLACRATGQVGIYTLSPAPYRPAPHSHWGHYLGSGTSPGEPKQRHLLAAHVPSLLFWQLSSSTSRLQPVKSRTGWLGMRWWKHLLGPNLLMTGLQPLFHGGVTTFSAKTVPWPLNGSLSDRGHTPSKMLLPTLIRVQNYQHF